MSSGAGPQTSQGPLSPRGLLAGLLGSALGMAHILYGWLLDRYDRDLFYRSVQEDEWLEWATFWAFMMAALLFGVLAWWQRRATRRLPWFFAGVGLFCFVVAMEEISWGQRVLGYQPPAYFLRHNFQQELNFHNVMSTDMRQRILDVLIVAYGVALPLLVCVPSLRRLATRLAIVAPALGLLPLFAGALAFLHAYPWKFTGELVELVLGLGFLFAAVLGARDLRPQRAGRRGRAWVVARSPAAGVTLIWLLALALGFANAEASQHLRISRPETLGIAQAELDALAEDFRTQKKMHGRLPSECGIHKRLYTFVQEHRQRFLLRGSFAALEEQGLPEKRAAFLLDPWSTPYWIRDECAKSRKQRRVFIYSFGPNRLRDSSRWEIRGDDLGVVLFEKGFDAEGIP